MGHLLNQKPLRKLKSTLQKTVLVRLKNIGCFQASCLWLGWKLGLGWVGVRFFNASQHLPANTLCPLLALLNTGKMLSNLDNGDTVTVLQVDPILPLEVSPNEDEVDPTSAQPGPKRGHGRGRRTKGRRSGATAASNKSKGKERLTLRSGRKSLA